MTESSSVCVITGGTSGVGLATACRFASAGWRIAICGRDQARLDQAVESIAKSVDDARVTTFVADLTNPEAATQYIDSVANHFSRIDLLVNNAAMAPLAPIDEMSEDVIDDCIDLNIRSVYKATRAAWPVMKGQGNGLVINISSQAAVDPFPGFSLYGATKAWIELFTVALAGEGRPLGIRSYCIRPGAVETPMLRGLFADFPADQCVSPQQIAEAVFAVCQPAFESSSGQVVKVSRQ